MKKALVFGIPSLILVVLCYFLFFSSTDEQSSTDNTSAIVTRLMTAHRGDIKIEVSATGIVTPINVIEIKSKASGIVERIPIEASDPISRGQLIVRLDQSDTRNAFEQALADSEVSAAVMVQQENNLIRSNDLLKKELIAPQEYDQINVDFVRSKSNVIKAKANLVLARQKLAETTVLSPIDGIVLSRLVSLGQIVSSAVSNVGGGTTIARLANMDEVYVVAAVDEVDIGKVQIGQKTRIVADAFPEERFAGKIIRIASQSTVIQNVTTFDVVVLVANRENKLKSGMNASMTITIAQKEQILLIENDLLRDRSEIQTDRKMLIQAGVEIPQFNESRKSFAAVESGEKRPSKEKSIRREEMPRDSVKRKFVVVSENGKLFLKPVRIGLSNFEASEVLDGITDSTQVAYVKVSQAKKDSDAFKERLKSRSALGR